MSCILIIGAGSAGSVVAKKCIQQPNIFTTIHVASRTYSACEQLKEQCQNKINIHQLDADIIDDTIHLIRSINQS